MKIQELYEDYIGLKQYVSSKHILFTENTLYNNYIKPTFGNKEISTLNLIDYQNFTFNLLSEGLTPLRIRSIVDILISLYRYSIMANYYEGENIPLQINLDSLLSDEGKNKAFQRDRQLIIKELELKESLSDLSNSIKKFQTRLQKIA